MSNLIYETLKPFLARKEINEDNFVCQLFHKVTVGFLVLGTALVAANQYIGAPIKCDAPVGHSISGDLLSSYCWIHGSYHLPENFTNEANLPAYCVRKPQENQLTDEELLGVTDTLYYQWVPFMLMINAIIFIIPHQLWKTFDKGYLKKFCNKSTMNREAETTNDHFTSLAPYYADFFRKRRNQNMFYFIKFLAYEFLNLVALIIVFVTTDHFLDSNFNSYGTDVINYANENEIVRSTHYDPMCNAFPTLVSCIFKRPSVTGKLDQMSFMCILSQNIINEKIYLFLWFWYVLLFALSALVIIYRMALIFIPGLRMNLIQMKINRNERAVVTTYIRHNCTVADWFLLYQIADNVDSYFLEQLLLELSSNSAASNDQPGEATNLIRNGDIAMNIM